VDKPTSRASNLRQIIGHVGGADETSISDVVEKLHAFRGERM